jgi:hypothetical protein
VRAGATGRPGAGNRRHRVEHRVERIYLAFAEAYRSIPPAASFWREMAADERFHALIVKAARELFPPTAPPPPGDWQRQIAEVEAVVREAEVAAARGCPLLEAFGQAERIEGSEIGTITGLILE